MGIDNFLYLASLGESAEAVGKNTLAKQFRSYALQCPWQMWVQRLRNEAEGATSADHKVQKLLRAIRLGSAVFNILAAERSSLDKLVSVTQSTQQLITDVYTASCYRGECIHDFQSLASLPLVNHCDQSKQDSAWLITCHNHFHTKLIATAGQYVDLSQPGLKYGHTTETPSITDGVVVTWHGYVFSLTGFGDEMRHFVLSLHAVGMPIRVLPVEDDIPKMATALKFFPSAKKLMQLVADASKPAVASAIVCRNETSVCHTVSFQSKRIEVAHALHAVDYDNVGSYIVLRVAWETLHPEGWLTRPLQPEVNADEIWATSLYNINLLIQGGIPPSKIGRP